MVDPSLVLLGVVSPMIAHHSLEEAVDRRRLNPVDVGVTRAVQQTDAVDGHDEQHESGRRDDDQLWTTDLDHVPATTNQHLADDVQSQSASRLTTDI